MPIDLTGISNENEFYSNHYLTTSEEGPIRDRVGELDKEGDRRLADKMVRIAGLWTRAAGTARTEVSAAGRVAATRDFAEAFLEVLGYRREQEVVEDAEGNPLPLLVRVYDNRHEDALWVVEAIQPAGDDFKTSPLGLPFVTEQFSGDIRPDTDRTIDDVITKGIFDLDGAPRYVIVLSLSEAVLVDRFKWGQSRILRFDLETVLTRREPSTLSVSAAILHRSSIVPMTGQSLLEEIEEESHRHAYGVSSALKAALREAIELLGNEAARLIADKRRARREAIFEGDNALDERELTVQCIRYMYRLLFLLYVEARPELGFAPIKAPAYRLGYALESLRELELVPLRGTDADGSYIADRVGRLFKHVFEGTSGAGTSGGEVVDIRLAGSSRRDFTIEPVKVELFAPEATSLLNGLPLRDLVMQRIIRLMSLSDGRKGRRVGRISYAQLGISQLGAVYETLLSFTGFFARTDLIEVRALGGKDEDIDDQDAEIDGEEDDSLEEAAATLRESSTEAIDPLAPAWFVPLSRREEFKSTEIVFEGTKPKVIPKGTFVYRLSGRDRQSSASYYTPEPLARLLVSHALQELLGNGEGQPKLSADEILKLRICEPAMGSAAFLVEVVNQLADAYLKQRQAEVGRTIQQSEYALERQKVRAYIADRNVFGVDLNPVAIELGQISLWLNCLHAGGFAPWFGDQLHAGNSLIGARRAAWTVSQISAGVKAELWHARGSLPREIGWKSRRGSDEVWQFLVPDPVMADYPKHVVSLMEEEDLKHLKLWSRGEKAPKNSAEENIPGFFERFTKDEIKTVLRLSKIVDNLFDSVASDLQIARERTNDHLTLWPGVSACNQGRIDFREKVKRIQDFRGLDARNAPAWRRLKTAMDAWCSLFFWPTNRMDRLPSRAEYLRDIALVLEGGVGTGNIKADVGRRQNSLFEDNPAPNSCNAEPVARRDLFGEVDIDELIASSRWLPTAVEVAIRHRFMHYDLEFADVLKERGGFDVVIGNPPWIKPSWIEKDILGDLDPAFVVKNLSASAARDRRDEVLAHGSNKRKFLSAATDLVGLLRFTTNDRQMPFIGSGSHNLYRCFMDLGFRLCSETGVVAMIHQDGHLTAPDAGVLRKVVYDRLRKRFHFRNQLKSKMFAEVDNNATYSANIYGHARDKVFFDNVAGAFLPTQIDGHYAHDGIGAVPSTKDKNGKWDTRSHAHRIVRIDGSVLNTISLLSGDSSAPSMTKFISPYSQQELSTFSCIAAQTARNPMTDVEYNISQMVNETTAQKELGIIEKRSNFPESLSDAIISGPMFHVGNPLFKAPRHGCRTMRDYDSIDLFEIGSNYIPRTNFAIRGDKEKFLSYSPRLPWEQERYHADSYRLAIRRMIALNVERSLVATIVPPGLSHLHTVETIAFRNEKDLVDLYPLWISLPFDYITKIRGKADLMPSDLAAYPAAAVHGAAAQRALRLTCITEQYAELWERHARLLPAFSWSSADPRVGSAVVDVSRWDQSTALRDEFSRRMALVEIDVLVAMAIGLSLQELVDMYRMNFPVLQKNDANTWYDQSGRIVWSCSKGLSGVGFLDERGRSPSFKEWLAKYASMAKGELVCEVDIRYDSVGPRRSLRRFNAPFTTVDRVSDYTRAWEHFAKLGVPCATDKPLVDAA
ncbi:Eco57I restriction-modification methylase domain-containing protein [Methylorubrum extorquens]